MLFYLLFHRVISKPQFGEHGKTKMTKSKTIILKSQVYCFQCNTKYLTNETNDDVSLEGTVENKLPAKKIVEPNEKLDMSKIQSPEKDRRPLRKDGKLYKCGSCGKMFCQLSLLRDHSASHMMQTSSDQVSHYMLTTVF